MIVIPAIDLLDGRAVRLVRGERDSATVFSEEPWRLVESFADAGAERIHVVDLDGAFAGAPKNREAIARIVEESSLPIQLGGGLRDRETIESALESGISYAVVGTAAVKDPDMVAAACRRWPKQIVIAVDAKDGMVAVEGWVETSQISAVELGRKAQTWGAAALLYTDVARDGARSGPNVEATAELAAAVDIPVIASGGVGDIADLRALSAAGIPMVIVGRALYDRRFTLEEAIAAC